ncbi:MULTISPECIES: VOC family protein [unclassified Rhizobium]|uniref:VOC family protein n=1 Tax=unclassified Rhizobium TaxID=2613769 RepID=UPI001AE58DFA|nr:MULTISPECIES: VOC family protein [unclassified Rhizobium]MBP2463215.1 catechol 2,3-dioxygenase-like lactoylglutathione lyase family enzyme [Rhizobium sp. PvP014]MBP2530610.1 catechol 2,3-dioxygenase-like lactoylglutathione lyase family enzyme [Rhizobium sp. PvP099]
MIDGILETALYVDDLDAAEAFYGELLGLERVLRAGDRHVFYRCGPGILLIFNRAETLKPPPDDALPVPPHGTPGPGHVCFRMDGPAIDRMVEKLNKAGIVIESDFRWPTGARSLYFRDPAGNSLECAEPRLWNL